MAAKKRAPEKNNSMKVFYAILAIIALLGVGSIVYARSQRAGVATEAIDMEAITDASTLLQRARGVNLGDENAPVRILVFSDFQCPGCGAWASTIEPQLKAEFISTGKVRLTYYDFPLAEIHDHAFVAARAARCAEEQSKFWEFHDQLFANQFQWGVNRTPPPVSEFLRYGEAVGLDKRAFESCIRSDKFADLVTANTQLGQTLRVGGTPTVFINNRNIGDAWNNYGAVKAIILESGGA